MIKSLNSIPDNIVARLEYQVTHTNTFQHIE